MNLPLTIIGGFLGAGKTTLLRNLLTQADGRRIAVLVNDFGELNIDASLIAQNGGDTLELSNGCVCCSIGDDLNAALIQLEARAKDFDHVVIEASGVSDPWKIAQIGLINAGYRLDGVVVVIDASRAESHLSNPRYQDTLLRQCRRADLLLLNKIDLAGDINLDELRRKLLTDNTKAHVMTCIQGRLAIDLLLGSWRQQSASSIDAWGQSFKTDTHLPWQSLSFLSDRLWTKASFSQFLKHLPQDLLRGKALINLQSATRDEVVSGSRSSGSDGATHWLEWHRVSGRDTLTEHVTASPVKQSVLVLIGLNLDQSVDAQLIEREFN